MTMVAETVDAVIDADTHRDTRALEMTARNATTIASLTISNNASGFADALAWIAEHAPGPRLVVGLRGTRSYGIGLARVLTGAGLTIVEVECPLRHEPLRQVRPDRRQTRCAAGAGDAR